MKKTMGRRMLAVALACAFAGMACGSAAAATPPDARFAVLSLVGDKVSIVIRQDSVGSSLDRNSRQDIAIKGQALDRSAIQAIDAAMARRGVPEPVLLLSRDEGLYAAQEKLFESGGDAAEAVQALKELLAQSKATHLLLLTKHRADAGFETLNGRVGRGKIAGLGFYVDNEQGFHNDATGRDIEGYFAPFAYVKLRLIDARSLKVLAEAAELESRVVSTASSATSQQAWSTMSTAEKLSELDAMLQRAATRAVEQVLNTR